LYSNVVDKRLPTVWRAALLLSEKRALAAPTAEELQSLLLKIITRIMRLLTRQGFLIEEQGTTYLAEAATDGALTLLQAASCTYRIALGPRAGQKVLSLQSAPTAQEVPMEWNPEWFMIS
jgi:hypothetical protein